MPVYEYRCRSCGHSLDALQPMGADPPGPCPACGGELRRAYGRARRTHAGFASRHGLPGRTFEPGTAGAPSHGVRGFLDMALAAVEHADGGLSELQDSMRPVEVGDAELRAGLAAVRALLSDVRERATRFVRTLGR